MTDNDRLDLILKKLRGIDNRLSSVLDVFEALDERVTRLETAVFSSDQKPI